MRKCRQEQQLRGHALHCSKQPLQVLRQPRSRRPGAQGICAKCKQSQVACCLTRAPKKQLCRYTPDTIGIEELAGHDGHLLVDPRYAEAIFDCANGARDMGAVRVVIKDRHLAAIDEAAPQDVIDAACRQGRTVQSSSQSYWGPPSAEKRTGRERRCICRATSSKSLACLSEVVSQECCRHTSLQQMCRACLQVVFRAARGPPRHASRLTQVLARQRPC